MKTTMLLAGALALSFVGGAAAKANAGGLHAHKAHRAKTVRPVRRPALPPKDPYAAYWNDPGRQAPPFSYFRGDR